MDNLLRRYLRTGITTVIDVGSTLHFLQQRDSFLQKPYAPAIYMAGPLLTTWGPQAYKNLGADEPFLEMKTEADARSFVQKQLPYKPDFIKIWYIVRGSNIESGARQYLPLVKAAIDEAHKNNLKVAVHATERITAQLAVEAGANFLVHGIDNEVVDQAFLDLLKKKNVVVSPTLVVAGNYQKALSQQYRASATDRALAHPVPLGSLDDLAHLPDTALTQRYKQLFTQHRQRMATEDSILRLNLRRMLQAGISIATGTDAGNIGTQHSSSYFDELSAMQQAGFDLWSLLQAATINGAKAIGKEKEWGSLKVGKTANMVLLQANPLDSLTNWQKAAWIINKGVAIQPDSLQINSPESLAQEQLNAYNNHDLEAFLKPYAEDVEVYTFPDQLRFKGKEEMRKRYQFITRTPQLYCDLQNRIVQGNTVIDHEKVYGFGSQPVYVIAVYKMENGKIKKVYFIQ